MSASGLGLSRVSIYYEFYSVSLLQKIKRERQAFPLSYTPLFMAAESGFINFECWLRIYLGNIIAWLHAYAFDNSAS